MTPGARAKALAPSVHCSRCCATGSSPPQGIGSRSRPRSPSASSRHPRWRGTRSDRCEIDLVGRRRAAARRRRSPARNQAGVPVDGGEDGVEMHVGAAGGNVDDHQPARPVLACGQGFGKQLTATMLVRSETPIAMTSGDSTRTSPPSSRGRWGPKKWPASRASRAGRGPPACRQDRGGNGRCTGKAGPRASALRWPSPRR